MPDVASLLDLVKEGGSIVLLALFGIGILKIFGNLAKKLADSHTKFLEGLRENFQTNTALLTALVQNSSAHLEITRATQAAASETQDRLNEWGKPDQLLALKSSQDDLMRKLEAMHRDMKSA